MFTPSGRFQPGMRLCLSISDYHPKTWNPAWSASTILTGLLSFMVSDEVTAGSIAGTPEQRKKLAKSSKSFNNQSKEFKTQFPDIVKKNLETPVALPASSSETDAKQSSSPQYTTTTPSNPHLKKITLTNKNTDNSADKDTETDNTTNNEQKVAIQQQQQESLHKRPTNGMPLAHKMICAVLLLVSWIIASRLFSY